MDAAIGPHRALRVLVTGATGYIGGRLVTELLAGGHEVVCLVRNPAKLPRSWAHRVTVVTGDVGDDAAVSEAATGADAAYYLVHSMSSTPDFREHDRRMAESFRDGCAAAGVGQIIYLGGLGDEDDPQLSEHLRSRHEVGRLLRGGPVPVTELRAAVIIGSGSASFEMLRALVEVLPVMVVPRWVHRTRCQPIAVADVLAYLIGVLGRGPSVDRVFEIGGPDVLSYRQMMDVYAEEAGLRRRLILPVNVLSPGLSSRWIGLVTPLPVQLARPLVDSLVNDVVVVDRAIDAVVPHRPVGFREAVRQAVAQVQDLQIPTRWTSAELPSPAAVPDPDDPEWAGGTVLEDQRRVVTTKAGVADVYAVCSQIGGDRGWYVATWMWRIRGAVDKLQGGVGLRRGRRDPDRLRIGDPLDFWRVTALEDDHRIRLLAEMKLPGYAWLEWVVEAHGAEVVVTQRARFVPRGLFGRLYWYALWPFHQVLFPRLARDIVVRAERRVAAGAAVHDP